MDSTLANAAATSAVSTIEYLAHIASVRQPAMGFVTSRGTPAADNRSFDVRTTASLEQSRSLSADASYGANGPQPSGRKTWAHEEAVSYPAIRPGLHVPREIGFSIASNRGAGYDRHANRLPSKALTSGDSQAQPSSPHRKDSMPEPSALPWKVAAEKAAGELDTEKFRHHVLAAETAIFFRLQELSNPQDQSEECGEINVALAELLELSFRQAVFFLLRHLPRD